jgi:hypothetical protein
MISLTLSASTAVWADSKSATIRVSCTIDPMIEIASEKASDPTGLAINLNGSTVKVRTNLGKNYQTSVTSKKTADGFSKLYSVTAL